MAPVHLPKGTRGKPASKGKAAGRGAARKPAKAVKPVARGKAPRRARDRSAPPLRSYSVEVTQVRRWQIEIRGGTGAPGELDAAVRRAEKRALRRTPTEEGCPTATAVVERYDAGRATRYVAS